MTTPNHNIHENSERPNQEYFNTVEMELILASLEHDKEQIDQEKMDRVIQAWSKVERKKLYKN
jgi:hypothetical protein